MLMNYLKIMVVIEQTHRSDKLIQSYDAKKNPAF
jgi:hypothetical protein